MKKNIITILIFIFCISVYNTEDCDAQWVQTTNGMGTNQSVSSFVFKNGTIFAGTLGYGIYTTTNNGTNWYQIEFTYLSNLVFEV